ncbi:MAG: RHS repeat-associated core domain-containing protein [Verrucomicrobiota bacterium]
MKLISFTQKTKLLSVPFLVALLLLPAELDAINKITGTPCTGPGGCKKDGSESDDDSASGDTEGSIRIKLYAGPAALERPTNFSAMDSVAQFNTDFEDFPQGIGGVQAYFDSSPIRGNWAVELELVTPEISAESFDRSSLTYNHDFKVEKYEDGGGLRQMVTDYFLIDIEDLPSGQEGFHAKWYAASAKGNKVNNLYVPTGIVLKDAIIKNPNAVGTYTQLDLTTGRHSDSGWETTYRRFSEATVSGKLEQKVEIYDGDPSSGGSVIESETLRYLLGEPVNGVEQYPQEKVRTIRRSALDTGGGHSGLHIISREFERYELVGGNDRLVRSIQLSSTDTTDNSSGLETKHGYFDNPGTPLHGRKKWELRPDGSWTVWKRSYTASTQTIKAYTPFQDGPTSYTLAADGSNADSVPDTGCRIETRTLTGPTSETSVEIGTATGLIEISNTIETYSTGDNGERVSKTERLAGADSGSGAPKLVTYRAFHPYGNGTTDEAGRIAWETHDDGTATVYSYAPSGVGGIQVTSTTGAATGSGAQSAPTIVSGEATTTVTKYNEYWKEIESAEYDASTATGTATWSWDVTLASIDDFGRPIDKNWEFGGVAGGSESFVYDCCGLKKHTDRNGSITETYRDELKRVYKIETRTVAASSKVETLIARSGLTTTTTRDGIFISEVTRSLDGLETRTVNPSQTSGTSTGRITTRTITDAATRTTTWAWLSATSPEVWTTLSETTNFLDGRRKSVSGDRVTDTTYAYTAHGEVTYDSVDYGPGLTTTATSSGRVTESHLDSLGRTFRTVAPSSGTTNYTFYPADGSSGERTLIKTMVDADGVSETYGYDSEGKQTTSTRTIPVGSAKIATNLTTTTETDIVTPAGQIHGVALGLSYRTVTKLGNTVLSTAYRSVDGLRTAQISLTGDTVTVSTFPDAMGVASTTTTLPDGTKKVTTSTHGLTTRSEIQTGAGASIAFTTYSYDAARRMTGMTNSETGLTDYDLDDDGNADVTESGLPLQMAIENGDETAFTYDVFGRRTAFTVKRGGTTHTTHTSYDNAGNVAGSWGSQTYPTYRIYNDFNQLTKLRTYKDLSIEPTLATAADAETEWIYGTITGLLDRKEYHDGNGTDYTYTNAGRLKTRVWERNVTTTYGYTYGMMTGVTYSDTSTPAVTYTYDALGRRESVSNANAISEFTYAADFGVDKETITYTLPGSITFTRVLDRRDRSLGRDKGWELIEGTAPNITVENEVTYGYESNTGFLTTVVDGNDTFTYGYKYEQPNPGDSRVGDTSGSDQGTLPYTLTRSGTPSLATIRTYEPYRNVLDTIDNRVGGATVSKFAYAVNELDQRTNMTTTFTLGSGFSPTPSATANPGATDWQYDGLGQVESADAPGINADRSYLFDDIGNRKQDADSLTLPGTDNYLSNALNQYTTVNSLTPSYDDDGNATSYPLPAHGSANSTLAWDGENRLISSTVNNTSTTYLYDALNRRIAKTIGANTTVYVYDSWNLIAEYAGTSLDRTYTWGMDFSGSMQGAGGIGGLLAVDGGGTSYFPTYDGNGNISEYLDSTGGVVAHFEYDPFGRTVADHSGQNSGLDFLHRFSTKQLDGETGLYYYGYRYYDPVTGRWPSRDLIGERGGMNLYGFVGNNGIDGSDLIGLCKVLSSKKVLAGQKVATLDEPFENATPYQNLAENIRSITDRDYEPSGIRFLKKWETTGFNWSWADDKWAFAAFYLLYVEWEVDESDGPCETIEITETITNHLTGEQMSEIGGPVAHKAWTKARKKGQPENCTTVVYADAPGGPVITGQGGEKPRPMHMSADARVYLVGGGKGSGPVDYRVELKMKPNGESEKFHGE